MAPVASNPKTPEWRRIGSLILRVLLALAFAASALFKLSGHPTVIDEFARVGLGQWFRYVTAALELVGAALLVWPKTIATGALVLGGICTGAFFAQVFRLHINIPHTIILGAVLAAIAWTHRAQLLGGRRR